MKARTRIADASAGRIEAGSWNSGERVGRSVIGGPAQEGRKRLTEGIARAIHYTARRQAVDYSALAEAVDTRRADATSRMPLCGLLNSVVKAIAETRGGRD